MNTIDRILEREGGAKVTNRSSDRGGLTKYGITQAAWTDYRMTHGFAVGPVTVVELTEQEARDFYFTVHIAAPHFDLIADDYLQDFIVDCGVNHGVSRAARWLQEAAGVSVDGAVGPKTLERVNAANPVSLLLRLFAIRARFYAKISSDQLPVDPDLPNLQGWINRLSQFVDELAARLAGR
jgi:lysozyme family protein